MDARALLFEMQVRDPILTAFDDAFATGIVSPEVRQERLTRSFGQVSCERHRIPEFALIDDYLPCPDCKAAV